MPPSLANLVEMVHQQRLELDALCEEIEIPGLRGLCVFVIDSTVQLMRSIAEMHGLPDPFLEEPGEPMPDVELPDEQPAEEPAADESQEEATEDGEDDPKARATAEGWTRDANGRWRHKGAYVAASEVPAWVKQALGGERG